MPCHVARLEKQSLPEIQPSPRHIASTQWLGPEPHHLLDLRGAFAASLRWGVA